MYGGYYYGQTYYGDTYPSYGQPPPSIFTPASVFHDNGASSSNYTTIGANTAFGGNVGMFGSLGSSPAVRVTYSGSAYVFEGAKKDLGSATTIFQFFYRPAAGAALGTGNTIFGVYTDNTYAPATAPIRLDLTPSSTSFKFSLIDPSNSFATVVGTTTFTLGTAVKVVLAQTAAGWNLYLNNSTTPEIVYAQTQTYNGLRYVSFGTLNQNAAGSYSGIADFGEIWCGNKALSPSTAAGKSADAYAGYLQNHLAVSGQPYRGVVDGNNLNSSASVIDTVSEGVAYFLKLAVQNNDYTNFNLCDNWVLKNLLRSNSTALNTQSNAAPTNALNLMAFHYNSANTDGKGIGTIYDANWASDSDVDRAQALLWAHSRFGSSALSVGSVGELLAPNYLQRALNVLSDLRAYAFSNSTSTGYNYLLNDSFQLGNAVVQIAPDYNNPAAYYLFGQYDSGNKTFWNSAVLGAYDILTKAAAAVFSGSPDSQASTVSVNPNWLSFTVASASVSSTRSTYGDPNYGFNSFRTSYRLYDTYNWYADSGSLSALRLPKTEWATLWTSQSKIPATLNHDGTNLAAYELTEFTYAAYWSLYAGDTSNSTATAINSGKLTGLYYQAPYGSIISEIPSGQQYGYFGQSWSLVGYMQQNGLWTNYGQGFASGGGTSSGTASITVSYPVSSIGGGASSGTSGITDTSVLSASGGGLSSGSALVQDTDIIVSTGGGSSSGACSLKVTEVMAASGGGASSGTALIQDTDLVVSAGGGASSGSGSLSVSQAVLSGGGGSSSGTAVVQDTDLIVSIGGGTSSGTASVSGSAIYAVTANGGGVSSGSALLSNTGLITAGGTSASSGAATLSNNVIPGLSATGGGTGSGTAFIQDTDLIISLGGGTSGGTALLSGFSNYAVAAVGGGVGSGASSVSVLENIAATGGGTSSGSAVVQDTDVVVSSGGGGSSGSALLVDIVAVVSTGGGASGGVAALNGSVYSLSANGSGSSSGSSTVSGTVLVGASGVCASSGTATLSANIVLGLSATGGGTSFGTAFIQDTDLIISLGGGSSSGSAFVVAVVSISAPASGGVSNGSASVQKVNVISALGGGSSSGVSAVFLSGSLVSSGGGSSSGSAFVVLATNKPSNVVKTYASIGIKNNPQASVQTDRVKIYINR